MDIFDYQRLLRRRWRLVIACIVLGIAGALAYVLHATPMYSAHSQLFVATSDAGGSVDLNQGGQFAEDRVKSYASIINSPPVVQPVIDQLGLHTTAKALASRISASAPPDTVLINVSATDASPKVAQELANGVAQQFTTTASTLEDINGEKGSPVKVSVIRPAYLPTAPVSPNKTLDLIIGLIIGLVVGVGAAILRELLDNSVKDQAQITRRLELPVVGSIFFDREASDRPLIAGTDARSARSEAFRQLRTNLQFADLDRGLRSIVITSSVPGEGKTTTATNLSIALAQAGVRVLLVEGDLRRPKVAGYLGIDRSVGLTSVLLGTVTLDDAVQQWPTDGKPLHVLPSGPIPPNPSEVLGSQGMADLAARLHLQYDMVIYDTPPLLPVTDAAVLSTLAGGVVLIARYGKTTIDQLSDATESLRAVGARLYGVVLSMTPSGGPSAAAYAYQYSSEPPQENRAGAAVASRQRAFKGAGSGPFATPSTPAPPTSTPMPTSTGSDGASSGVKIHED